MKPGFLVSSYCPACDPSRRTATGRAFHLPGVAVDPKIIPLGSLLTIPGYGAGIVADDTGRLIKGRRLDVRLPAGPGGRCLCHRWGLRQIVVKVTRRGRGR